jgi:hypothetical protein
MQRYAAAGTSRETVAKLMFGPGHITVMLGPDVRVDGRWQGQRSTLTHGRAIETEATRRARRQNPLFSDPQICLRVGLLTRSISGLLQYVRVLVGLGFASLNCSLSLISSRLLGLQVCTPI